MMLRRVVRLAVLTAALGVMATDLAAAASGVSLRSRMISLGSPFHPDAQCIKNNPGYSQGFEQETAVAVNPHNPRNILVSWIQDGRATDTVMASRDGGRTFSRVLVPGLSACTGGAFQVASDPGVEFAADGTAYFIAIVVNDPRSAATATTAMVVSRSRDGGFSWERPRFVQKPTGEFWDLPKLTPDPRNPKRAYYVYSLRFPPDFLHGYSVLSTTDDGGRTWSPARKLYDPQTPNLWPGMNKIIVNHDGSLLNVSSVIASDLADEGTVTPPAARQIATRSTDGGRTWGPPITIGTSPGHVIYDPVTSTPLSTFNPFASHAVAPNGDVYVSYLQLSDSPASSHVAVARSTNGGRTWTTRRLAVRGEAALPTVGVAGDGTVAVSYYAIDPTSSNGFWRARAWLETSRNRGRRWSRTRIAGQFNLFSANTRARGCCFLGDYVGMARLPRGLVTAFTVGTPIAKAAVDVRFSRITTSR
jgi:hypothetical protein